MLQTPARYDTMQGKHFAVLVVTSSIWGASFMMTKVAVPALGSNLAAAMRMTLAALCLMLLMRIFKQPWPWQHWRILVLAGLFGVAAPHIFYNWAALYLPASYGSLISVCSVFFGALASHWHGVEALSKRKWTGCILGFIGTYLVLRFGPATLTLQLLLAACSCLIGSFFSGLVTPYLKRCVERMEPLAVTACMHLFAVPFMLPGALYDLPKAHFTGHAMLMVGLLGIFTSGLTYWVYLRVMRHISPVAAIGSTFMITGFGVLWATLLLHETVDISMLFGAVLLLTACFMVMNFNPLEKVLRRDGRP